MCERSPKHVSRELKTDWGKGGRQGARVVRVLYAHGWGNIGRRGEREGNRIMETLPERSE